MKLVGEVGEQPLCGNQIEGFRALSEPIVDLSEHLARLPQFKQGVLRTDVQPRVGLTPYARFGNYPVIGLAAMMLVLAARQRRKD